MAGSKEKAWIIDEVSGASSSRSRTKSKRKRTQKPVSGSSAGAASTSQWLAVPTPNGGKAKRSPAKSSNGKRSTAQANGRRTQAKLRRANNELEAKARRIEELEGRVEELEDQLASVSRPGKASSRAKASTEAPRRSTVKQPRSGSKAGSRSRARPGVDINAITFEELRALGLSVTQSARLIGTRDTRNGFKSLDELNGLPGFSQEMIRELQLRVKAPS